MRWFFSLYLAFSSCLLFLLSWLPTFSYEYFDDAFRWGIPEGFLTCASHLTAVFTFYGPVTTMYLKPSSIHSMDTGKFVSEFYTMVIPMLNPIVYNLRKKEINALKRVVQISNLLIGLVLEWCTLVELSLIVFDYLHVNDHMKYLKHRTLYINLIPSFIWWMHVHKVFVPVRFGGWCFYVFARVL